MLRIKTSVMNQKSGITLDVEVVFEEPYAPGNPKAAAEMIAEFERALAEKLLDAKLLTPEEIKEKLDI